MAVSCACASGSAVIVVIYACVVTCGRSFTVLSGWGILVSFLECFSVFSHPPLPLINIIIVIIVVIINEVKHYCCWY